ncbi:MAG: Trk system potassium transporter TrkA [Candidatus Puniceispirillales bacterium]
MKIVICGAGQVGFSIAGHLSQENNDVTIIDENDELIQRVTDHHNVRGVIGVPSHPDILAQADVGNADMLIAVTTSDEINMVACQVAHSIYRTPLKIARIHSRSYLDPRFADMFSTDNMPIDHIISPEIELSQAVLRRLEIPGAFDVGSMCGDKVKIIGVKCTERCPILGSPIRYLADLFDDLKMSIIAILRDNEVIVLRDGSVKMMEGDEVYFVCEDTHLSRAMTSFGHEEPESRRILIAGGGNIATLVANAVHETIESSEQTVIEVNKDIARQAALNLPQQITIIHGDALEPDILHEGGVADVDTFIALTDDDEVNVLSSLLARRFGANHVVTLIKMASFVPLISTLGVDSVINPPSITVSSILEHVRRGRVRDIHTIIEEKGEVMEIEALASSSLVGTPLRSAKLPKGAVVGAIMRNDQFVIPRGDTIIEPGDKVIMFVARGFIDDVERMLSVRLDFF